MKRVKPLWLSLYVSVVLACMWLVTIATAKPVLAYSPPQLNKAASICEAFKQTKDDFEMMSRIRSQHPTVFSDETYKVAAFDYLNQADACYHATLSALQSTADYTETVAIDHGPLIPPDHPEPAVGPRFSTKNGFKWGAGSPFVGGQDATGPGIPGGLVTYSFMPANVYHYGGSNQGPKNIPIENLTGFDSCFYDEIDNAFAAWSAVSDIQFAKVTEVGQINGNEVATAAAVIGNIRIGAYNIDGSYGVLAQAYYPPYNGAETTSTVSGDITLDASETWGCTPDQGIDIGIIVTHEIGHAIGFSHQTSDRLAIMNPYYNPSGAPKLLQDDITGAQTVYSANGAPGLLVTQPPLAQAVLPGGLVDYTLVVENPGMSDISGATITNPVPDDTTYVSNSANSGGTLNNGSVTWSNVSVPAQSSVTRSFQVRLANSVRPGDTLVNTAFANPGQQPGGDYTLKTGVDAATCGFSDNFDASSTLGAYWTTYTTNNGRIRVANNSNFTHSGSRSIWLDTDVNLGAINSHAAIVLNADLTNRTGVVFDFWWRNDGDELHADDGVFLSDDNGATWVKVYAFNRDYLGTYHNTTIDIDAEAVAHNLSLNHQFKIKLQGYDNYAFNGDGYAIDDVSLTCDAATPDLSITKTATTATPLIEPGDAITYTIVIANNGNGDAHNVAVYDDLPTYITGAHLDETVLVRAFDQVTYTLHTTLGSGAPFDSVITNTAHFNHSSGSGQASATVSTAADTSPPQFLVNDPATGSPLITPTLGITVYSSYPNFEWHPATDNDRVAHYVVKLSSVDPLTQAATVYHIAPQAGLESTAALPRGPYTWTVQAYDPAGNVAEVSPAQSFILADPADAPPGDDVTDLPGDKNNDTARHYFLPILIAR
ncbi:MAG: matrixin family metalloprotease [Anaerolineae bacterium]|nr:matrixin family metalloprotease [Anaerolineae bacterium]